MRGEEWGGGVCWKLNADSGLMGARGKVNDKTHKTQSQKLPGQRRLCQLLILVCLAAYTCTGGLLCHHICHGTGYGKLFFFSDRWIGIDR